MGGMLTVVVPALNEEGAIGDALRAAIEAGKARHRGRLT